MPSNNVRAMCSAMRMPKYEYQPMVLVYGSASPSDCITNERVSKPRKNLSSVAVIDRVKERTAALDQTEVMDVIDSEVDAARARRP